MHLVKVKIINYRQLQNVELDLQDSLTVLAGPNNSGKTTLISVLKGMFYDKKLRFNYSDIPTNLSTAWLDKILPVFQTIMTKHDKETGIREIVKQISSNEAFAANYVMESFQAQIQVDYDPVSDDIQCFADYLMDLDENKHSFTMLKMKTLIITDLDYDKAAITLEDAKSSISTNATINHCYRLSCPDKGTEYSPTIDELYDFQKKDKTVLYGGLVYLVFQDENSTARTLEEAMLNKLLGTDVFKKLKRSEWKSIRKKHKLTFTIPNNKEGEEDSEYSIRKIVEATSNNKTDFMYSVILSGNEEKMLPDYIKEGLLWLAK